MLKFRLGLADRSDDELGGLLPHERLGGVRIVRLDVATQLLAQGDDAGKDSTMQRAALKLREPRLDGVEPRSTGGGEVKLDAWMFGEKRLDPGCRVGTAVVEDQMEVESARHRGVDVGQEFSELLGGMARSDPSQDLTGGDVEGGVETCGPVARVVVSTALDLARPQRQARLCSIQGLNLRLFVHREHHRVMRWPQVQA